ncbi:protein white-like [Gigantopelta aegis]|uniref:protein white-like n=1 Tax=Gigantopelta aegis TaxID=1735272 RepID=UPI001B888E42|nr:protein white-like [Gigantopelta aegis]
MSEDLEVFLGDDPSIQVESTNAYISNTSQGDIDDVITHRRGKAEKLSKGSKSYSTPLESRLSRSLGGTEPICLSWRNINVFVKTGQNRCFRRADSDWRFKQILRNVNGLVNPRTLLAIIGASGAGKSSLLNVLTGRNVSKYCVTGEVQVNGINVGTGMRNISAYVQQHELFIGNMTVKETLVFRALLRMDKCLDQKARLARVDEVIGEMGLSKCVNTRIGTPGGKKGISGGEMKRLSFACEMLTNPPLMFCDEPTSGLDSFMAQNIVQTLKETTQKGRTILCTIHQPSSEVFALFDHVLLLAEGRTAFMGTAQKAYSFFSGLGYPCPVNFNPADFYVLTLAIIPGKEDETRKTVQTICDAFDQSEEMNEIASETEILMKQNHEKELESVLFQDAFDQSNDRYKASWVKQFRIVFWRTWMCFFRDDLLFKVRAMQSIVIGLVLGLVYLRQDYDMTGVRNISGAIFLIIANQTFVNLFAVLNTFPIEIAVFLREYGSGLYRVDVYYLAKIAAEMPSFIVFPFLYSSVSYWLIGLHDSLQSFVMHTGVLMLVANISGAVGYFVSSVARSVSLALSVAPPLMVPLMLFGGFLISDGSIPVYFIWMKYVSWFKFANELLIIIQWKDVTHIDCPQNVSAVTGRGCYANGSSIIKDMDYNEDYVYRDIGLLFELLIVFHLCAFMFVFVRARRSES